MGDSILLRKMTDPQDPLRSCAPEIIPLSTVNEVVIIIIIININITITIIIIILIIKPTNALFI